MILGLVILGVYYLVTFIASTVWTFPPILSLRNSVEEGLVGVGGIFPFAFPSPPVPPPCNTYYILFLTDHHKQKFCQIAHFLKLMPGWALAQLQVKMDPKFLPSVDLDKTENCRSAKTAMSVKPQGIKIKLHHTTLTLYTTYLQYTYHKAQRKMQHQF